MSLPQEIRRLFESLEGRGILGQQVAIAAVALPGAAAYYNLYTVTVGEILLTALYGICTVDETGGAITGQFGTIPTVGGAVSPMSAASPWTALNVGDIVAPQGDITLPSTPTPNSGAAPTLWMPWVCKVGSIGVTLNAATATSSFRWVACYIPLTDGALLTET